MPAGNALSERSFSVMCQIKNYLRTTNGTIDLMAVANEFVSGNEHHLRFFGIIPCFLIRFRRCCWISTLVASADGRGELRVKGTLTARSDTGSVNHSPTSSTPLTVRLQYGCSHTIQIPGKLYVLFYLQ